MSTDSTAPMGPPSDTASAYMCASASDHTEKVSAFDAGLDVRNAWAGFAAMALVLDVPAEAAADAFPQALSQLCECTGACLAALVITPPGGGEAQVRAVHPGMTERARRALAASVQAGLAEVHPAPSASHGETPTASGSSDSRRATNRNGNSGKSRNSESFASTNSVETVVAVVAAPHCLMTVPLHYEGKPFGVLCIDLPSSSRIDLDTVRHLLTVAAALFTPGLRAEAMPTPSSTEAPPLSVSRALHAAGMVGNSEAMQPVYARLAQVASSATTVMLRGESGTGKELVARAIHAASPRAQGPFVSLSCAALPESLIESELFGHEKGAFTGAIALRKGRFELAHGGTLFLDEVGELPLLTQAKLLRVLQERRVERLGGMESRPVDIRVITATNRPLEAMVEDGGFRRDLYYRLNVFAIHLPALSERPSDILLLAQHFLARFAAMHGRAVPGIALSAADMLHRYPWPGNIRELENTMERALLLMDKSPLLLPEHLPPELHSATCPFCATALRPPTLHAPLSGGSLPERLEELERASIMDALTAQQGHMGRAANALGLTERVLHLRMRKFGLTFQAFRNASAKNDVQVEKRLPTPKKST